MIKFKGCYQILNDAGEVIAELRAPTTEAFNDTKLLKRIVDVIERRYFKLQDMRDGLSIQVELEEGGCVDTKE